MYLHHSWSKMKMEAESFKPLVYVTRHIPENGDPLSPWKRVFPVSAPRILSISGKTKLTLS
jgi:hypothetical protein